MALGFPTIDRVRIELDAYGLGVERAEVKYDGDMVVGTLRLHADRPEVGLAPVLGETAPPLE